MFISILRSFIRAGSLCVIDARGRHHVVGDDTTRRATIRLTSKRLVYSLAINRACQ